MPSGRRDILVPIGTTSRPGGLSYRGSGSVRGGHETLLTTTSYETPSVNPRFRKALLTSGPGRRFQEIGLS